MTIAILTPTKGRPAQFKRMVESVLKTADGPVPVIAAYSEDDIPSYSGIADATLIVPDWMPTVHKWNMLAEGAMKDESKKLFMLAADDIIFATPHWDKAIIDHYNALDNKIHVYALQDSRDPDGTPHQIVTREWIEAMGWFCPPYYLHWNTDTWTTAIAKPNGVFTHLKDYLLIHDKPSDKGIYDATHTGIRAMGWHDRDQWVAKHCDYLLDVEIKRLAGKLGRNND